MGGRGQASLKGGHYNETEALNTLNTSTDHAARNTAAVMLAQNARTNESTTLQRQDMPIPEKMASVPVHGLPVFFANNDSNAPLKLAALAASMDDFPDLWKPIVLSATTTKQKSTKGNDIVASSSDDGSAITFWNDEVPTLDTVAPVVADAIMKGLLAQNKPLPFPTYQSVFDSSEPSPSAPPPFTMAEDFQDSLALYLQDKFTFQDQYPLRFAYIDNYVKTHS
jgi:hypothetical protein